MKSLQRQLTTRVLVATLAISAAAGTGLYGYVRSALIREFDAATTGTARAIAALVEIDPVGRLEVEFSAESLPEYYNRSPDRFFELRSGDGSLFAGSPGLDGKPLLPPGMPLVPREAGFDLELPDGSAGRGIIVRFEPWLEPPEPGKFRVLPPDLEDFTLVLARDRGELDRTLALLLTALLLAGAAVAGLTTLAVVVVVRRGLRPVQAVAEQAAHIDANSLDKRLPVAVIARELRPICQCINELLARVESGFKRERQFTANVAHELRTPIAELRAMTEVAMQRATRSGVAMDPKDVDALDIALQMEAVVGTLLALTRCHAGTQVAEPARADLGELVSMSWRRFARRADARGLRTHLEAAPGTIATTDRSLLAAMLDNLFANAVEYTPPGGTIRCKLDVAGEHATITIGNPVTGLAPDDVPRMCEPFWRKDGARSAGPHSGLGLALVDAYARLLGVSLALCLTPDQQFVVRLTLRADSSELGMSSCENPAPAVRQAAHPAV